jgi:hypothetical protein
MLHMLRAGYGTFAVATSDSPAPGSFLEVSGRGEPRRRATLVGPDIEAIPRADEGHRSPG